MTTKFAFLWIVTSLRLVNIRQFSEAPAVSIWVDFCDSVVFRTVDSLIQCVPLATEPGISLIILPLIRILQRNLKRTTDTFLFISHTTNVLLFKFRCNIFIGVRIIKEMLGSVASGTPCTILHDITSDKKQICAEFSGKYVRRCQFERCESDIAIWGKKKALLFFFFLWAEYFHGRVKFSNLFWRILISHSL